VDDLSEAVSKFKKEFGKSKDVRSMNDIGLDMAKAKTVEDLETVVVRNLPDIFSK